MKMNILDILHTLGWKIISADNFRQIYVITQSSERLARAQEIAKTYQVTIDEMCYDETGNLYISFMDKKTKEFVDNYYHNGMDPHELY